MTAHQLRHRAGLCLALLGPAACWVPTETGKVMQRDITKLQTSMQTAQKTLDEQSALLTEQMGKADTQIQEVDLKLRELNRAARKDVAGIAVDVEEIRKVSQELRGQIELLNHRLTQMLDEQTKLKEQVAGLESSIPDAEPAPKVSKSSKGNTKDDVMIQARELIKKGQIEKARGFLREIVQKWPTDTKVAGEAYFRLGELYFKEKKYRSALQEYINVVEKFPKGRLADDSYHRIGLCSMELGNYEDAQIFFSEIIKNHKKSPLLKSAQKMLADVDKKLAAERKKKKRRR